MRDWFNSRLIVVGAIVAVFATAAFFLRGWNKPDNIIDLSLLRDRNFVAGTLAITAYGISLFGWMALMPLFSQRLLGYAPAMAGTLFIPRAVVSAITLAITGSILIKMFDARYLVAAGLVMTAIGTLLMAHFTLYVDYWGIATPGIWSRHRHRAVLRAAHRRGLRQHSEKPARRGIGRLRADARHRRLGRHRRGELAVRAPDADSFRRAHGAYHAV